MDKLKIIKIIVCLLTFLLVFGALSALGIVYKKISRPPLPAAESINLKQPHGSIISDYKIENGILYILIKNGGESDRILMMETERNAPLASIKLN